MIGPDLELQVVEGGKGEEAGALRARMKDFGALVRYQGHLEQAELARCMREATVLVLPSFYEGLPSP